MKKLTRLLILISIFCSNFDLIAQIQHEVEGDAVIEGKLGVKKTIVDPSAAVEIQSTNEGILIPRMTTTQRSGITSPAKGLLVFDNTTSTFWFHNGIIWTELADTGGAGNTSPWTITGSIIHNNNNGDVGIGTTLPKERLQIENDFAFHTGGHKIIGFNYEPGAAKHFDETKYAAGIRFDPVNGNLRLGTSAELIAIPSTHLTLDKIGYVGIGTQNPETKLTIVGGTDVNGVSGGFIQAGALNSYNMGIDNNVTTQVKIRLI